MIGYSIVLATFCLAVYRGFHQSITHDEARTYALFVAGDWRRILFVFDSNNHTLFSLLAKVSTTVFGLSEQSLRVPSLLGGLGFMLAAEQLCRHSCRSTFSYASTLSALVLSPFVLDYLVAARGYGLALCFFMWAFLLCCIDLEADDRSAGTAFSLLGSCAISWLCALSVASNLAFAFVDAALLGAYMLWLALDQRLVGGGNLLSLRSNRVLSLTLPGACLYFWINPAILHYDSGSMYFGATSWSDTYTSIVSALFDDFAPRLGVLGQSGWAYHAFAFLPPLLAIFVVLAGIGVTRELVGRHGSSSPAAGRSRPWLLAFSVLGLTIALHWLAHSLFGVMLPLERTGVFFVPLCILLAAISIERMDGTAISKISKTLGRLGIALAAMYFLLCLRTDYFRQWRYDAGSRETFSILQSLSADRHYDSIGITWTFEPSLNFYRTLYKADNLPEFARDPPNANEDLFVLYGTSADAQRFIANQRLRLVYEDALSGAVVAVK